MEYEVHLFLGLATIRDKSSYSYAVGGKHGFLLYLKEEENSDFNWVKATHVVEETGLNDVQFTKAGKTSYERVKGKENEQIYLSAMNKGSAIMLYSDPVD